MFVKWRLVKEEEIYNEINELLIGIGGDGCNE